MAHRLSRILERRRERGFSTEGEGTSRTPKLNSVNINIYNGLIFEDNDVNVIAYGAKKDFDSTVSLALSIFVRAGDLTKQECAVYLKRRGPLVVGENLLTSAGNLPFDGIIHALGPSRKEYPDQENCGLKLYQTITNILETAKRNHLYRIAITAISIDEWPPSRTSYLAEMFLKAIKDFCNGLMPLITDVHIVDSNETVLQAIQAAFEKLTGGKGRGVPDLQKDRHRDDSLQSRKHSAIPSYKMNAMPRGICLIINIRVFDRGDWELGTRVGSEKDVDNLKRLFRKLHFSIKEVEDLEGAELARTIAKIGLNINHSRFDCFVCCILSHGFEGNVYGSDGRIVPIKTLTTSVQASMCPTLAGKPKLFFIQACQGDQIQGGLAIETDAAPIHQDRHCDSNVKQWIPDDADFLLGYSTVPGYAAIRNRTNGSWYINKLVEVMERYHDRMDMVSMLGKVNDELSKMEAVHGNRRFKQMSSFHSTLRKKVYFFN
ncbi:hypothetical protein CHS0354_016653 [Potamilus streckersoni]|uniref:Caspase-8 n=1 Tax=Potamilus streckersoni TaxID=2493646 RepID=A0AAE0THG5_9BIVA|nr:hypothetical protein CHS0354_016653 [Potamilus streckersoni]